jgi:pyrroloquinoline-quinone synthase
VTFGETLKKLISEKHLLKHPFYQSWTMGTLQRSTLREYARQYFAHVEAFPRYVSATHSACESLEGRQFLLENLIEEERGSENHPELWLRFGEGVGASRASQIEARLYPESQRLVDVFLKSCRSSFAEGLACLYAYESQVPEIAEVKIAGLREHYGVSDERALAFFEVHKTADRYHRETEERLLNALSPEDQGKALAAAESATQALWDFLTGVEARMNAA